MARRKSGRNANDLDQKSILGKNLKFAAAEAYKLLRTNLVFALSDIRPRFKCNVIGVTSSESGEGKSTTSINLAYTLAEDDRKVLLIEGDMRRGVIAQRLGIKRAPGLSNVLAGMVNNKEVIQRSGLSNNLYIVSSGEVPPNPSELLGSRNLEEIIKSYEGVFDFIIIDLPPINAVSDALVVSDYVDGMLVTVRQNYCTRSSLKEAMRQLEFANVKILGFVMTDSVSSSAAMKRKKYKYVSHSSEDR